MRVEVDKKLLGYMHDHHKHVIALKLIHDYYSGYNANIKHPRIKYKKPYHEENYDKFEVKDITIFVEKNIPTIEDQLTFTDDKFLGIHQCHVLGLDIKKLNDTHWDGNYYTADD